MELRLEGGEGELRPAAAPLTEVLALDPTRQRHTLRDRLTGAERTVDYGELAASGLELILGPWEFQLLEPAGESPDG